MRAYVFLAFLFLPSLAQSLGSVPNPAAVYPLSGPVYVLARPGTSFPPEIKALIARAGEVRILLDARAGQWNSSSLRNLRNALGLPKETKVAYRLYPGYPPIVPLVLGPNWLFVPPGYFTDLIPEVGAYWKVVTDAWEKSRPVPY